MDAGLVLAFVSQGRAVQIPLHSLWMGRLRSRDREGLHKVSRGLSCLLWSGRPVTLWIPEDSTGRWPLQGHSDGQGEVYRA